MSRGWLVVTLVISFVVLTIGVVGTGRHWHNLDIGACVYVGIGIGLVGVLRSAIRAPSDRD